MIERLGDINAGAVAADKSKWRMEMECREKSCE
jgi:hypothetical protein